MEWRKQKFADPILYTADAPSASKSLLDPGKTAVLPSAVLVFHGMGQQVRFETVSDLASAILDEAEAQGGNVTGLHIGIAPRADEPGQFLARAEIAWTDNRGIGHAAHVYEAYWAPLTEGKVGYWDTIKFLLEGGWNGLKAARFGLRWTFDRWVFDDFKTMPISKGTPVALLAVIILLGCTVGAIAWAGVAVESIVKKVDSSNPFAAIRLALTGIYIQFAGAWNWIDSAIAGRHTGSHALLQMPLPAADGSVAPAYLVVGLVLWCLLVWLIFKIRYFIIAYVGSVTAYLSPYKDSKFEELRSAIQKVGLDAARLIYYGASPEKGAHESCERQETAGWIPDYKNIVFVAHSLGTVIAYDTLNAIFNIENTSRPKHPHDRAVARTRALITFGSPLDKTAFIFRNQFSRGDQCGRIREMMACAIQPLITDYKAFRFNPKHDPPGPRWINLWSPMDIISGRLDYYDNPKDPKVKNPRIEEPWRVINQIDWACWVPFYAHIQYWKKKMLRRVVYSQLV